jgi:hypothetical protein
MTSRNSLLRTDVALRLSETFNFMRTSLPNLMRTLGAVSDNPSALVQQLIEHRLALPLSAAMAAQASNAAMPASASTAILKLASDLQDKHQPSASESHLADTLIALEAAGVATLVIKGLAYGRAFYPDPSLRRSTDHDILVAPESRIAAHDALCALGFRATSANVFQSICGQASYRKNILDKAVEIDLHWELGNNFALHQKFDFETLMSSAVAVEIGSYRAMRMNDLFCALHCALNYCSDHPAQRSYLALLDLALITRGFTHTQQQQLLALANSTQTLAVLQFAFIEAEKLFGVQLLTAQPVAFCAEDPLLRALESRFNSSALWWPITTPRPQSAKLKFIWFQALPPKAYMQARYKSKNTLLNLHFKRWRYAINSLWPRTQN